MILEWTGRCHALVEEIIYTANAYSAIRSREIFRTAPPVSPEQVQLLQYLLEHEGEPLAMKEIAAALGMTKSAFTKLAQKLARKGLVEKEHPAGNRKTLLLRATPQGKALYGEYVRAYGEALFRPFFQLGEALTDQELAHFTQMMRAMNEKFLFQKENQVEIRLDEPGPEGDAERTRTS